MKYAIGGVVAVASVGVAYYLYGRSRKSETSPTSTVSSKNHSKVGLTILDTNVGDLDWHRSGNLIAYAKRNPNDGYFDVWVVKPDGTGRRCLTCGNGFPRKHMGSVTWRPSGDYLAFTAQNEDATGERTDELSIPGVGLNCNLWVMKSDSSEAWRLTNMPTNYKAPRGVIHPQFSNDGTRLFWTEAVGEYGWSQSPSFAWGEWALALGEFVVKEGIPSLRNVKKLQLGEQHSFYESHDFSPDDSRVLFSGNLIAGQPVNGLDIYELELATGDTRRLTSTFDDWDEHAHYSHDGKTITWMSGKELDVDFPSVARLDWQKYVKTELWMMKSDGSDQRRITFFNQPESPDYEWFQENVFRTPRVIVSDNSWGPNEKRMALTVAYEGEWTQKWGSIRSILVMMDLEERG